MSTTVVCLQLCADESGVYHGHCGGVTKYLLHDGTQLWYRKWTASIFGVVQVLFYGPFLHIFSNQLLMSAKIDLVFSCNTKLS